ncbi:40S ribosomal eS30 domain-containing protein [Saccharomyces paradoxus]|uniref:40S ribosomal eS30 domain-containing protein n=6 Tax=Saccharomycetaceae TaxID=4893 RepID=A0A8B8V010_SACPA|nr:Rps30b [Saccharomyces paradoxus]QHS76281.1 Rps30b [Saccharomyces paradoxus]
MNRRTRANFERAIIVVNLATPCWRYAKVHGSLARAGKVKSQTPKVEKTEKPKKPKGRAYKRLLYTRRFVNVTLVNGKRRMNPGPSVQ